MSQWALVITPHADRLLISCKVAIVVHFSQYIIDKLVQRKVDISTVGMETSTLSSWCMIIYHSQHIINQYSDMVCILQVLHKSLCNTNTILCRDCRVYSDKYRSKARSKPDQYTCNIYNQPYIIHLEHPASFKYQMDITMYIYTYTM